MHHLNGLEWLLSFGTRLRRQSALRRQTPRSKNPLALIDSHHPGLVLLQLNHPVDVFSLWPLPLYILLHHPGVWEVFAML